MLEPLRIELSRHYETQLKRNGIAKPLWNLYEVAAFAQSALPRNLEPVSS